MIDLKTKLTIKVTELLATYKGGESYFDALDEYLRLDDELISYFIDHIDRHVRRYEAFVFVSGKFGDKLSEHIIRNKYRMGFTAYSRWENRLIRLPGGIRNDSTVLDQWYIELNREKTSNEKARNLTPEFYKGVFVDDSFYKGRTFNAVKELAARNNVQITTCAVLYDGSKTKQSNVHSLYRYYDYH